MALTTYSGQNMGAGELGRVKKGLHRGTFIVLIFSLAMIPIAYLFGKNIVGFFVKESDVIDIAYRDAQEILKQNIEILHAIATELIAKEKINEERFNKFFE